MELSAELYLTQWFRSFFLYSENYDLSVRTFDTFLFLVFHFCFHFCFSFSFSFDLSSKSPILFRLIFLILRNGRSLSNRVGDIRLFS